MERATYRKIVLMMVRMNNRNNRMGVVENRFFQELGYNIKLHDRQCIPLQRIADRKIISFKEDGEVAFLTELLKLDFEIEEKDELCKKLFRNFIANYNSIKDQFDSLEVPCSKDLLPNPAVYGFTVADENYLSGNSLLKFMASTYPGFNLDTSVEQEALLIAQKLLNPSTSEEEKGGLSIKAYPLELSPEEQEVLYGKINSKSE